VPSGGGNPFSFAGDSSHQVFSQPFFPMRTSLVQGEAKSEFSSDEGGPSAKWYFAPLDLLCEVEAYFTPMVKKMAFSRWR